MSIRDLAASDHAAIVQDVAGGFAIPIVVTNPEGVSLSMNGLTTDVGEVVDMQSGMEIAGRRVSVQILTAPLIAAGMGEPRAVMDGNAKPWLVTFANVQGVPRTYKIFDVKPDEIFGSHKCLCEAWQPS